MIMHWNGFNILNAHKNIYKTMQTTADSTITYSVRSKQGEFDMRQRVSGNGETPHP